MPTTAVYRMTKHSLTDESSSSGLLDGRASKKKKGAGKRKPLPFEDEPGTFVPETDGMLIYSDGGTEASYFAPTQRTAEYASVSESISSGPEPVDNEEASILMPKSKEKVNNTTVSAIILRYLRFLRRHTF